MSDHLTVKTTVRDGRFKEYDELPVLFQTLMNALRRIPAIKRAVTRKEASYVPAERVTDCNGLTASVSAAFNSLTSGDVLVILKVLFPNIS